MYVCKKERKKERKRYIYNKWVSIPRKMDGDTSFIKKADYFFLHDEDV